QRLDDVPVVDDLLAHVDRGAVQVESLLHGYDRPVHAGAVAPRSGEEHAPARVRTVGGHALNRRLRGVPLETSADQPVPVRTAARLIAEWVARLGRIWVEGQVAQLSGRPGGTTFLTLRDPVAEASLSVTVPRSVLEAVVPPLTEGARVVVHGKP